jgi:Ca2+-binding RTX toxin-like protein
MIQWAPGTIIQRTEGNSGITDFIFPIFRTGNTSITTEANWSISSFTEFSLDGSNFFGGIVPAGIISFFPGEFSKEIIIRVTGDTTYESDLYFEVALGPVFYPGNIMGPWPGGGFATGIILNDDAPPPPLVPPNGNDSLRGDALNNVLNGAAGNDTIEGLGGDDKIVGGLGADRMVGGSGNDTYYVDDANDAVVEASGEGYDRVIASIDWTLSAETERLSLTGTALNATGNGLANRLDGNAGANVLSGGAGDDRLYGNAGSDALFGGEGNDTLDGGLDGDRMFGGLGDDTYYVDNAFASDMVIEASGGGYDRIIASVNWTLDPEVERLSLSGTAGLSGIGNALANRLDGNAGANRLSGAGGDDGLHGGAGQDTLIGGEGNDTLDGGLGADSIEGGNGADVFLFRQAADANGDTVSDFSVADGDRINLRPIDANVLNSGNQGFTWIGSASFGTLAGQLRFADGILAGDVNGDGTADFQISVTGVASLTAASIWL